MAEDNHGSETLLAIVGAAPAKVVIGNSVSVVEEKAPFKPPFVAHAWHCTLLSAVSVGITDRAGKLYLLGIIFGDFLPCTPCFEVGEYADRGKGISLFLFGFGIISGRFLTVTSRLFIRVQTSTAYGGMATDFGFSPLFACLCVLVALVREENPPCTQRGCHCSKYQPQSCAGSVADSVQNP